MKFNGRSSLSKDSFEVSLEDDSFISFNIVNGNYVRAIRSQLYEIFIEAYGAPPRNEVWSVDSFNDYLEPILSNGAIVTAEIRGEIIGYASILPLNFSLVKSEFHTKGVFTENSNYISDISVSKKFRNNGVGLALSIFIVNEFPNCESTFARVRKDFPNVKRLLEDIGFITFAESRSRIGSVDSEKYLLRLSYDCFLSKTKKYEFKIYRNTFFDIRVRSVSYKKAGQLVEFITNNNIF